MAADFPNFENKINPIRHTRTILVVNKKRSSILSSRSSQSAATYVGSLRHQLQTLFLNIGIPTICGPRIVQSINNLVVNDKKKICLMLSTLWFFEHDPIFYAPRVQPQNVSKAYFLFAIPFPSNSLHLHHSFLQLSTQSYSLLLNILYRANEILPLLHTTSCDQQSEVNGRDIFIECWDQMRMFIHR